MSPRMKGLHLDTKVCNCAECGALIVVQVANSTRRRKLVNRIKGRPYCSKCLIPAALKEAKVVTVGSHHADYHTSLFSGPHGCPHGHDFEEEDLDQAAPLTSEQQLSIVNGHITEDTKQCIEARKAEARRLKCGS